MTRRLRVVIAVSATCLFALVNWNLFLNSWLESRSVDAFDDPGSVYNLTAADIRVIAALGDSISAGLAAKAQVDANRSILFKTFENRGVCSPRQTLDLNLSDCIFNGRRRECSDFAKSFFSA